jgi:hypothetical protein
MRNLLQAIAEGVGWVCIALWLGGALNAWEVLVYIGPRHSITTTTSTPADASAPSTATQPERHQRHGTTPTF